MSKSQYLLPRQFAHHVNHYEAIPRSLFTSLGIGTRPIDAPARISLKSFQSQSHTSLFLVSATSLSCITSMMKLINTPSGDSWSRTGFNAAGTQPSTSNPLGNVRSTSSNGLNWVQYFTTAYNTSLFLTYNFAQSGATIDEDIVTGTVGASVDIQLHNIYQPTYASQSGFVSGKTSLFTIWIGINDLVNEYLLDDDSIPPALFVRLRALVEEMYSSGARQFLFLNAPPLEKAPRTTQSSQNATRIPIMKAAVADYNTRMYKLARAVNHDLAFTTVFFYDINRLMNAVIDDPSQFAETKVYKDTKTYCGLYEDGTPDTDTKYDGCSFAADEYLWINSLHPTQPFHKLLARKVGQFLESGGSLWTMSKRAFFSYPSSWTCTLDYVLQELVFLPKNAYSL